MIYYLRNTIFCINHYNKYKTIFQLKINSIVIIFFEINERLRNIKRQNNYDVKLYLFIFPFKPSAKCIFILVSAAIGRAVLCLIDL